MTGLRDRLERRDMHKERLDLGVSNGLGPLQVLVEHVVANVLASILRNAYLVLSG